MINLSKKNAFVLYNSIISSFVGRDGINEKPPCYTTVVHFLDLLAYARYRIGLDQSEIGNKDKEGGICKAIIRSSGKQSCQSEKEAKRILHDLDGGGCAGALYIWDECACVI